MRILIKLFIIFEYFLHEVSADKINLNKEIDLYALSQNIQDVQIPNIEMSVMTYKEKKGFSVEGY